MDKYEESQRIASIELKARIEKLEADFADKVDILGNQLVKFDKDLRQLQQDQIWQEIDIDQNQVNIKYIGYAMNIIFDSHDWSIEKPREIFLGLITRVDSLNIQIAQISELKIYEMEPMKNRKSFGKRLIMFLIRNIIIISVKQVLILILEAMVLVKGRKTVS